MKNFNFRIFIISSLVIGLLVFISMMVQWGVEENSPGVGLFWIILAKSYWIFSFPINILFWIFEYKLSPTFILAGLTFNNLLVSLLIERLFYLRKKQKFPLVPTGI